MLHLSDVQEIYCYTGNEVNKGYDLISCVACNSRMLWLQ